MVPVGVHDAPKPTPEFMVSPITVLYPGNKDSQSHPHNPARASKYLSPLANVRPVSIVLADEGCARV